VLRLKQYNNLHIITARPEELRSITTEWIEKNFPKIFNGVHFTNQYQYHESVPKRTKGEICKELGIDLYVDDMLLNVEDVSSFGIPALLFDAPWNQGEVKPPIRRVYSWDEIAEILSK